MRSAAQESELCVWVTGRLIENHRALFSRDCRWLARGPCSADLWASTLTGRVALKIMEIPDREEVALVTKAHGEQSRLGERSSSQRDRECPFVKMTHPQACGDCLAERLIENITLLAPDLCVCKYCLREGGGGGRPSRVLRRAAACPLSHKRPRVNARCAAEDTHRWPERWDASWPLDLTRERTRLTVPAAGALPSLLPPLGAF